MKFKHAVIFTVGRTGSQIIHNNLKRYFNNIRLNHTHNPVFVPENLNGSIAILSQRHNILETILSFFIANKTNDWWSYKNLSINPISISKQDFENRFWFTRCFYHAIDLSVYHESITVWYEDLIQDPKYFFSLFGIDAITDYSTPRSVYDYYQLVGNIDQCKNWYDELIKLPVTESLINSARRDLTGS
jgi:hypothetical protein